MGKLSYEVPDNFIRAAGSGVRADCVRRAEDKGQACAEGDACCRACHCQSHSAYPRRLSRCACRPLGGAVGGNAAAGGHREGVPGAWEVNGEAPPPQFWGAGTEQKTSPQPSPSEGEGAGKEV